MNFGKVGTNGGIVLRVCYNNQGWSGRCKDPVNDPMCSKCAKTPTTLINNGKPIKTANDGYCIGGIIGWCWESDICTKYTWPVHREGKRTELNENMDVFLFYMKDAKNYVFFAQTKILQISGGVLLFDKHNFVMLLKQIRPSVTKKRLEDAIDPSTQPPVWRQGTYRIIRDINKFNLFLGSILRTK